MSLPVIYVCGPYRAATPWKILENIRAAQQVALDLWKLGAVGLCPHANTALFDGEAPDKVWLEGDLELLRRCDAVVVFHGWRLSQGALAEVQHAQAAGIPVFEYPRELTIVQGFIHNYRIDHPDPHVATT